MTDVVKALYDSYPPEEKNSFFHAYVYMRHIDHFLHHAMSMSGLPVREMKDKLDPDLEVMLKMAIQEIGDAAMTKDTNIYHAKVVKLKDAIQLVSQKHDMSLITPEKVIPFKIAKDIILKNPQSITVGDCPCREASKNPCLPLDVCMFIGDPGASFMADQNPKYRKITQAEAVKILEEEHERGHVHCAYFKREMGNKFFAICNCCGCCCLGVQMWNLLQGTVPFLAPSGYVAEIGDMCMGCGDCVATCQFKALSIDEKEQRAVVDVAKCMGCGVCEDKCSAGAIKLRMEASKGEPLDLEALMEQKR